MGGKAGGDRDGGGHGEADGTFGFDAQVAHHS